MPGTLRSLGSFRSLSNSNEKSALKTGLDGSFHGPKYGFGLGLFNGNNGHTKMNPNGLEIKLGQDHANQIKTGGPCKKVLGQMKIKLDQDQIHIQKGFFYEHCQNN